MSHKIYTTEAIVCGGKTSNTSDKSFLLFTREAGMLWATARSVREERSKQRFALQDFALARVSLVKGKAGWRIGSAEGERNYFTAGSTQPARAAVTAVVRLLRQFVHGELVHEGVFDDTKAALDHALLVDDPADQKITDIFCLRLLYRLGYIAKAPAYEEYLAAEEWWKLPPLPEKASRAIEKARRVSHL